MVTTKKDFALSANVNYFGVRKDTIEINGISVRVEKRFKSTKIFLVWSAAWDKIAERFWGVNKIVRCKNFADAIGKANLMSELGKYENGKICAC